jgi:hypothetical protein
VEYVSQFLFTYDYFTTAIDILAHLDKTFKSDDAADGRIAKIVLAKWMKNSPLDFFIEPENHSFLKNILQTHVDPELFVLYQEVILFVFDPIGFYELLLNNFQNVCVMADKCFNVFEPRILLNQDPMGIGPSILHMDTPEVIAKNLTMIDHEKFVTFLNQFFSCKKDKN